MVDVMESPTPTVHFVHGALEKWADVLDPGAEAVPSVDHVADRLTDGQDIWIIGTYLTLKRRGLPVSLSPRFVPGAMCVAHYDDISPRALPIRSYVIAVRADRDPVFICDAEILQNPVAVERSSEHYIPHWVQPGLIMRDPSRGTVLEHLAYLGRRRNLAHRFRSSSFEVGLASLGISFHIRTTGSEWRNYGDVDVVLAVRDGTPQFFDGKPATKLFNAWQAGCPALVGPESAYRSLRESELDFFEVHSPDDAIQALHLLKSKPDLYARMVRHGRERVQAFSRDAIADRWRDLLFGTLVPDFRRWSRQPLPVRAARFAFRLIRRKAHGKQYARGYDHLGKRVRD